MFNFIVIEISCSYQSADLAWHILFVGSSELNLLYEEFDIAQN